MPLARSHHLALASSAVLLWIGLRGGGALPGMNWTESRRSDAAGSSSEAFLKGRPAPAILTVFLSTLGPAFRGGPVGWFESSALSVAESRTEEATESDESTNKPFGRTAGPPDSNSQTATETVAEVEVSPVEGATVPPPSFASTYLLHLSTEDNYRTNVMEFHGQYALIRSTLDYSYHANYTRDRQLLQDGIVEALLNRTIVVDKRGTVCRAPEEPWIVFTAGAMGAGKSFTVRHLASRGRFPLQSFVSVDPDEIRRHLPEFRLYVENTPQRAGELTRKEAGYISEILTLAALRSRQNVLVDGSLRDSDWYSTYFEQLRKEYERIRIAILHIKAPREAVFERAANRSQTTGRVVPRETLKQALEQVPKSVKKLAPLSDFHCEISNAPGKIDVELITEGETWESFRARWMQTCALDATPAGTRGNGTYERKEGETLPRSKL